MDNREYCFIIIIIRSFFFFTFSIFYRTDADKTRTVAHCLLYTILYGPSNTVVNDAGRALPLSSFFLSIQNSIFIHKSLFSILFQYYLSIYLSFSTAFYIIVKNVKPPISSKLLTQIKMVILYIFHFFSSVHTSM